MLLISKSARVLANHRRSGSMRETHCNSLRFSEAATKRGSSVPSNVCEKPRTLTEGMGFP